VKKLLVIVFAALLSVGSYRLGQQSIVSHSQSELDLSVANSVWDVVSSNYLRISDVDQESMKYGLARGLVQSLGDQHSVFMDPDEANAFLTSLNGDLEGIGAELKLENEMVLIVNPLPGSPAEKAGIHPGDLIMKVDGEFLGSITNLMEVVMKIRGPKGTQVKLEIIREGDVQPKEFVITRESIHIAAVTYEEKEYLSQKVPSIRLSSFTENVGEEFEKALLEVNKAGYDKLILDLRYNGGGYLEGAVDILSYFLENDTPAVSIRNQGQEVSRNTIPKKTGFKGKVVVLVNDSSASASEIVAGALQDYEKAQLIGVKTFGKGSVQEVHPFGDDSIIRLTIAEWLTPKGRSIEKKGIEPDQIVELDFEAYKAGTDNQLQAALEFLAE
jgi:carboxyl-terminal processing protease